MYNSSAQNYFDINLIFLHWSIARNSPKSLLLYSNAKPGYPILMKPASDTTFSSSKLNFIELEHEILKYWEKERCFHKLQEKLKNRPLFRFLDGPITANNPMGVHHAWGRTLKDIFIRYHCLNGFNSRFQNGFDCQGLWVEVEVEKELGFKGKPDIEAYGLDKFSNACKERIKKFSSVQTKQSIRLGQWMDWSDSYYTHLDKNIEGIWNFLKTCYQNGWLYRAALSMRWCSRCGTSLSEHEMAGSYKTVKHLAVFLKVFVPKLNSKILVWTTTPWTLPANTALAVHPELEYSEVKIDGEETTVILCSDVLKGWTSEAWTKKNPKIIRTFKGESLAGLDYDAFFSDFPVQKGFDHKIVLWKEVDPKEGTGVVHIAPGCGKEDFELSKQLGLTALVPVDEKGDYVSGYGFLEGKNTKQVAEEVALYLKQSGKLYRQYMHEHNYPVCWRCKDELIFRLVEEWYISTKEIRPRLIEASRTVKWEPEHIGKRMEDWLQNMGDWCISRKRFWGLPLPFYPCTSCETLTIVGSSEELKRLSSDDLSKVPELHRPWIDAVKINCPKCGEKVARVPEVGDCWLDAGIVPYTTLGCFEKQSSKWEPADFICEMSEQVRLWFYSMLFMGVTLNDKAPYKRVLTYERVLSEEGTRFSKTGYMIQFDEAAEKIGVDTMRYYFASESPTNDLRFGFNKCEEIRRQLISYWNIYSFFLTYASIDKPAVTSLQNPTSKLLPSDRWLLALTAGFEKDAKRYFAELNTPAVIRAFETFTDGVSNWYVRGNRRRFWKSELSDDKLVGYWALLQALKVSSLLMSPIIPFMTERIWQDSVSKFDPTVPSSVHLGDWPDTDPSWVNEPMLREIEQVRQVINMAHRLRTEAQLKVRQPLAAIFVLGSEEVTAACTKMEEMILGELNVKAINYIKSKEELLSEFLELDLKKAGPVLKGDVSKAVALVNALLPEQISSLVSDIKNEKPVRLAGITVELPASIFIIKNRTKAGIVASEERSIFVALDTAISKELEEEGWIRELLRHCQVLRKDAGLQVQDRITLTLETADKNLAKAIDANRTYIEDETLGLLESNPISKPNGTIKVQIGTSEVAISLAKR